jgi:hypothetical protein
VPDFARHDEQQQNQRTHRADKHRQERKQRDRIVMLSPRHESQQASPVP